MIWPMRRVALSVLAAVLVPALAASGCASSSNATAASTGAQTQSLNGIYKTALHTTALGGALNGTWKLRLQDHTYTFNYTGKTSKNVIISGNYATSGHKITFKQRSAACSSKSPHGCGLIGCQRSGTYTFKLGAAKLSFAVARGSNPDCGSRRVVLARSFHKIR